MKNTRLRFTQEEYLSIGQYEPGSMSDESTGKDLPATRISSRMSHVGFQVPDLDKAMSFY